MKNKILKYEQHSGLSKHRGIYLDKANKLIEHRIWKNKRKPFQTTLEP
jgi:hypothetical protein